MKRLTIIPLIFGLLICCESKVKNDQVQNNKVRVFDNAEMLTKNEEDSLQNLINQLEEEVGSQIAIVTIVSLNGQPIEKFGLETFDNMRLGRPTINDGVLITIAYNDMMARIDVGTGLENILKDEISNRLLREDLFPKFIEEKYGQGLNATIKKISNLIKENKELIGQKPKYLDDWDSIKRVSDKK